MSKKKHLITLDQLIINASEIYREIISTDLNGDGLSEICKHCIEREVEAFEEHLYELLGAHIK